MIQTVPLNQVLGCLSLLNGDDFHDTELTGNDKILQAFQKGTVLLCRQFINSTTKRHTTWHIKTTEKVARSNRSTQDKRRYFIELE